MHVLAVQFILRKWFHSIDTIPLYSQELYCYCYSSGQLSPNCGMDDFEKKDSDSYTGLEEVVISLVTYILMCLQQ